MTATTTDTRTGLAVWHDHVSPDRRAAQRFYERLLGWEISLWGEGDDAYPMIATGETSHGGFVQSGPDAGPAHWAAYVVTDVDGALDRARSAGGSVLVEPREVPEAGRFAVLADPQGAIAVAFAPSYEGEPPAGIFAWDELVTTDVEAAERFYGSVFGWSSSPMDMGEAGTYTIFARGEDQVAGLMEKPSGSAGGPTWLSYLVSEDVDRDVARAVELGATLHMGPTDVPGIGRSAVLSDPTGAPFGLYRAES